MRVSVIDMHTGGEPVRIVDARDGHDGWPEPQGATILKKRASARADQDHLRTFLMFEPRGHHDMYGALIVRSALPGADFGVLFMHNEGWSTMCGHAVIALGRHAIEQGWVKAVEPVTRIGIECPCGLVFADVAVKGGKPGAVSFESVPAFAFAVDQMIDVPGFGAVPFDIGYGGAFYAITEAAHFGLAFGRDPVRHFVDAADALTQAVKAAHPLGHPESADLAFLYGSILTDGGDGKHEPTKNICVFAEREVDRSPTGSGVTARIALMQAKGLLGLGETRRFESITGAVFTGAVSSTVAGHQPPAIRVRVGGRAHYSGRGEFWMDEGDPLAHGFLVR
ncbi:MAG: proline racemase family protein [Rhizobiaceae bacterium]|jgi:trans-L-3-hydroxyproline dehydratase|nr:proline racemase family protein [Rhizobiaceae bacterium]